MVGTVTIRSLLVKLPVALLSVGLMLTVATSPAFAEHVQCGDVIIQDTTLDSGLVDCAGDGIVIGADSITLDLNRHVVDGVEGFGQVGVRNGGFATVSVNNGTVRDFSNGISLDQVSANRVARVSLAGNAQAGLILSGFGNENVIERTTAFGSGVGIQLSDSFGTTVIRNNTVFASQFGIHLGQSQNTTVVRNVAFDNAITGLTVDDGDEGPNVVEKNVANHNGGDGIRVGSGNIVARNTANRNADLGIEAQPDTVDGGGNRASGNGNPLQCLNVRCK
jgi:parallel beta-helix repeat protein